MYGTENIGMYLGGRGHVDLCKAISSIELTKFYINQTYNSIVVFAIFQFF